MTRYKVKTQFKKELEPEEILLDSEEKKKKEKGRLELPIKSSTFSFIFFLILFLFLTLFTRVFFLAGIDGEKYTARAIENYLRVSYASAPRGEIISSDGIVLAENTAKDIEKTDEIGNTIITKQYSRFYPYGEIFAHILGYQNEVSSEDLKADNYYQIGDTIGRDGLENEYETFLRGEKGKTERVVNTKGKLIEGSEKVVSEPIQGSNLVLNINAGLQKKLYEVIQEKVPNMNASAVALDPRNGKVLALVSVPNYDNNLLSKNYSKYNQDPRNPLLNRVLAGKYPSGSIIKPLIAAAALQENVITSKTKINCQGQISIPNPYGGAPTIKKDWKTHGITDLNKAIAESCNVYFFTVGGGYGDIQGLGIAKLKKYLDSFYIENNLGIDIPGEKLGFVPTPEWFESQKEKGLVDNRPWSIDDVYNVSIGQGFFEITPLHMASALSAVANGGKIYQPQIVGKITSPDGQKTEDVQPKILNENFISPENIKAVKEGMKECVLSSSGSCHQLLSLPVSSAGKTGTAETPGENEPHAWFVSFAPYENPEILLLIMVENGGGGEKVAEPIAKEVLEWYFSR
jgi:penicillin-binding protein 2